MNRFDRVMKLNYEVWNPTATGAYNPCALINLKKIIWVSIYCGVGCAQVNKETSIWFMQREGGQVPKPQTTCVYPLSDVALEVSFVVIAGSTLSAAESLSQMYF